MLLAVVYIADVPSTNARDLGGITAYSDGLGGDLGSAISVFGLSHGDGECASGFVRTN